MVILPSIYLRYVLLRGLFVLNRRKTFLIGVRQKHGAHVLLHIARTVAQIAGQLGHTPGQIQLALAEVLGHHNHIRAHEGGVADEPKTFTGNVRRQTDGDGFFERQVASKSAGDVDVLEIVKPDGELFQHKSACRVDGAVDLAYPDILPTHIGYPISVICIISS